MEDEEFIEGGSIMKKIAMIVMMGILAAFAVPAHADKDMRGNPFGPGWLSTRTCVAESMLLIATGSIRVHTVIVETPTVNANSYISIYNSTAASVGGYNTNIDTAILVPTNMNVTIYNAAVADDVAILTNTEWPKKVDYDFDFSSGVVVNKLGIACTQVLWNFNEPLNEISGISGSLLGRVPPLYLKP